jgi:hypothetical protein
MKKTIMCLALALMTNYVTADTVTLRSATVNLSGTAGAPAALLTTNNVGGATNNYPASVAGSVYSWFVDSDASSSASNTLWDLDLGTNTLYYQEPQNGAHTLHIYAGSITNRGGLINVRSDSGKDVNLQLHAANTIFLTTLVTGFNHINNSTPSVTIDSGSSVTITDKIQTEKVSTIDRSSTVAGNITITAATGNITLKDILARCTCAGNLTDNGGAIALTAVSGNVVVSGQIDSYSLTSTLRGNLTISATNGAITLANLDVGLVRNISLKAGTAVSITNLITGLTVDNGAGKVTGPFLATTTSNNITYHSTIQTTLGLKGNYNIFKLDGTTDVGYDLIDLDADLPGVADVGLAGSAGTTSADVVALLNVRAATSNTLEIFYDTTDHTNDVASWRAPNLVGSYSSVTNLFVTNTVTATALNPNTTYYYRFALSNEITAARTWQPQASRGFVTAGPISTVTLTNTCSLNETTGTIATTNALGASYNYARYTDPGLLKIKFYIDNSAILTESNTLWDLDLGTKDINYLAVGGGNVDVYLYARSVTNRGGKITIAANANSGTVPNLYLNTTGPIVLPEIVAAHTHGNNNVPNVTVSGSAVTITNKVQTQKTSGNRNSTLAGKITVTATTGDITVGDLLARCVSSLTATDNKGGDISLTASNGNVVVTGQIDSYAITNITGCVKGNLTISAPNGSIQLASMNVTNLNTIAFTAGGTITVLGDIAGLSVAGNTVTGKFPTLTKDIYYYPKQNTYGLSGTYLIYNGATDTGRKLISAVPVGTLIRFF